LPSLQPTVSSALSQSNLRISRFGPILGVCGQGASQLVVSFLNVFLDIFFGTGHVEYFFVGLSVDEDHALNFNRGEVGVCGEPLLS